MCSIPSLMVAVVGSMTMSLMSVKAEIVVVVAVVISLSMAEFSLDLAFLLLFASFVLVRISSASLFDSGLEVFVSLAIRCFPSPSNY